MSHRYNEIVKKTIKWRGIILHQMSALEKAVDNYIIYHLVGKENEEKISLMQLLIFGDNRITLENKRSIFHEIAQLKDENWYLAYTSIIEDHKKKGSIQINKDFSFVISKRNVFAHCIPDTTEEGMNDINRVGFIRFKDSAEKISFTDEDLGNLEITILRLTKYIMDKTHDANFIIHQTS